MSDDIEAKIAQLEAMRAVLGDAAVDAGIAALRQEQGAGLRGLIRTLSLATLRGQQPTAGAGTTQGQQAGRDIVNSPQIINLGTLMYGRDTSEDERRQLVYYLDTMTRRLDQLPLQGIEQRLDQQGRGMSLSSVYTILALERGRTVAFARGQLSALRRFFSGSVHELSEVLQTGADTWMRYVRPEYSIDHAVPHNQIVGITNNNQWPHRNIWTLERPMLCVEAIVQNQRFVLLGDPGSGKSTFVRHLALMLARRALGLQVDATALPDHFPAYLPILLPLRRLAQHIATAGSTAEAVVAALVQAMGSHPMQLASTLLHEAIRQGGVLLLFDGLDEVPTEEAVGCASRLQTLQAVRAFTNQHHHAPVAIVLTCRGRAFSEDLRDCLAWPVETLAPFTMGQVRHFVPAWYTELIRTTSLSPEAAGQYTRYLIEHIAASRQLTEMAGTPLLLTMMALVLYNKSQLPVIAPACTKTSLTFYSDAGIRFR
ncbi:MAG: NACHT domain-containing protein, partial [Chloroflexaceae bacterium]|nr:NACHT domain-containing protein [Chloroflexaceae bacterium]